MDLIGQLAGQLGIAPAQAQAIAGTVLGAAQRQAPPEAAAEMSSAIPEMSDWQQQAEAAPAPSGGLGGLGGLFGAAAGALGGQQARDAAAIVTLLGRFGLDPSKAATVAPIILSFLKERLDGQVLQTILQAAPMLAGAAGATGAAGTDGAAPAGDDDGFGLDDAAGMLGSLFGRK
jgi:hypothetical protein